MRIKRDIMHEAHQLLREEGCLIIEAIPKAGLTVFMSQLRDSLAAKYGEDSHYINCALPGLSLRRAIAERVGVSQQDCYPGLLCKMKYDSPLLLLIDRIDLAGNLERDEFLTFLDTMHSERLFHSGLAESAIIVGTCSPSYPRASFRLGYFSQREVLRLLGDRATESLATELHHWTAGSPALAAELSRCLPEVIRETDGMAVYSAVMSRTEGGRLADFARQDPPAVELARHGLAMPDRMGNFTPVPAYTALRAKLQEESAELVIRRSNCETRYKGRLLPLFPRELRILHLLAERPGQIFTLAQIYSHISLDHICYPGEDSVKTHLSRLRSKLPPGVDWIITRRGIGYFFSPLAPLRMAD